MEDVGDAVGGNLDRVGVLGLQRAVLEAGCEKVADAERESLLAVGLDISSSVTILLCLDGALTMLAG